MNIKKIIREVIDNNPHNDFMSYNDYIGGDTVNPCDIVSPRGKGEGGYISNRDALTLINKIKLSKEKYIKDPVKLNQFEQVIQNFESDIKKSDTNLDTIDTYLHKLRTILGC